MKGKNNVKYFLIVVCGFIGLLFFSISEVKAATKLALFSFEYTDKLEIEKGATLDLASKDKCSAWASSNPKVIKVSKKGIATAVKPGKAVISAKVNGNKTKCTVKVVKNIVKESAYINDICNTWINNDNGNRVTITEGKIVDGLNQLLTVFEPEDNSQEVAYKKCAKITAVGKNGMNTEIYFNAQGVFEGKKSSTYACVAGLGETMMIFHTPYVFEGEHMYGTGIYWFDEKYNNTRQ